MGRGADLRRRPAECRAGQIWPRLGGHDHLLALLERRDLSRSEARARRLRQQQCDTCARVCHSPTGYGLNQAFGTSAGTQDFNSVDEADVILVIGANPTDAHPVFGSRMKARLREGARLIVIDPRRIDLVKSPHVQADYHLALKPGTNVAMVTALAHVIVKEGLVDKSSVRHRCDWDEFRPGPTSCRSTATAPRRSNP